MKKVQAYTDGACSGNPGPGGWGVALTAMDSKQVVHTRFISGYCPDTTNNRMELQAAIEALKALKTACDVKLFTDSQYLVNTMTKGWRRNKNNDLWQELDILSGYHNVEWVWVKGHANNQGNILVDKLATDAIKYKTGKDYRT
jgi:ribonuclease HI